ncbi:glycosyltransferase family 2 protein [Rheinheimera sp.]|uniref:glycosyltransferase family 2 protein n=1 Tax=Rheinheimera sp. TaxID=1869214 RepID=UPI003AF7D98D
MKISVCITHFNRFELLVRAIDSVLLQGECIGEIIISDDFSSHNIQSRIKEKYSDSSKFKLIFAEKNLGPQAARNAAIDMSVFDYIALMDCDDIWLLGKLNKQIEYITRYNLDLCACSYVIDGVPDLLGERYYPLFEGDAIRYICSGGHMQTSTLVVRAEVAKKVRFDIAVRKFQDWDFVFRIAHAGYCIGYLNERLVDYSKVAEDQMTKSIDPEYAKSYFLARVSMIGQKNVALFYVNRLAAMYFKNRNFSKALNCFLAPIFKFGVFIPVSSFRSIRRFINYKYGI